MKKWTVTIEAQDEASALVYIGMMTTTFKAAVIMGLPMEHCMMEDPEKGEKLVCTTPTKKRFSWLRK
jgi:hypothetical protein